MLLVVPLQIVPVPVLVAVLTDVGAGVVVAFVLVGAGTNCAFVLVRAGVVDVGVSSLSMVRVAVVAVVSSASLLDVVLLMVHSFLMQVFTCFFFFLLFKHLTLC